MNKLIIKGRLTADPELKTTPSGVEICNFSVAVSRYAGKDKEPITDFIPCKAWRATAAFINTYFSKGKEILCEGNIHFDKYEKNGENRTYASMNVERAEFCGGKSESSQDGTQTGISASTAPTSYEGIAADDDDLPF